MSRFNHFLRSTGDRLALPKATRSQILVEIAADLDDLFQHYLSEGLSEEEAAARAEEKVDMSDEALAELVRIHSGTHGWTERMIRQARPFWERLAMALIIVFFVIASAILAIETDVRLLHHLTGFIWPIAGVFVVLIAHFVFQLVRSAADAVNPRQLRESLATPLFLGAASLVFGLAGCGITMYRALMRMAANPEHAAPLFARAFLGTTANFAVALLVALLAGVVWFVLAGRVARSEDKAAKAFLGVS